MSIIPSPEQLALGEPLPPNDPHGVSVSLPKWADTVGWATREPRVLKEMATGYPRFFIPRVVDHLAMRLLEIYESRHKSNYYGSRRNTGTRLALLLSTGNQARRCREVLSRWSPLHSDPDISIRTVRWNDRVNGIQATDRMNGVGNEDIILVSYPSELAAEAKAFWQHTGYGISSRRARHWLDHAPFLSPNPWYPKVIDDTETRHQLDLARTTLKQRIAAGHSSPSDGISVTEDDVFLYQTGMTAIVETAAAVKSLLRFSVPGARSRVAVFGFLYVDTYKALDRVLGYTPILYKSSPADIDTFESLLTTSPRHHIAAVFTEFPGNPLLQSPDLSRLHTLSRKHNFVLVVDDTVGTSANVHVLRSCDVVCTSLTKMFSGGCNVMGGAVAISPVSPFAANIKESLHAQQQDDEAEKSAWYWEDVLVMERNSRDFTERVRKASGNALALAGLLRAHQPAIVREVYYPAGSPTQGVYDAYRVSGGGGYGFLLSIRFVSPGRAVAFYDALDVAKGPSLGTNFTLCCAYTLLAHYKELEWAAEYGVVEDLVRISVGLEDWAWLEERVVRALRAAEACRDEEQNGS